MVKIGFDKTDFENRKFYFDDTEVLMSNPPKYKVWYVDNEHDVDYVLCSNVFVLKLAPKDKQKNNVSEKQEIHVSSPTKSITKTSDKQETIKVEPVETEAKINESEPPVKKKPGRKKKEQTNITQISDETRKFAYKVIDVHIMDIEEIQNMLNEYGQDGWELCGFEVYKNGLIKPNSILCVLKRKI